MGFRSTFGIGILALSLAATPAAVPTASAQGEDATNCLSLTETGGPIPNTWHNFCDFTVTVKWFAGGSCFNGCTLTVGNEDIRFEDPAPNIAFDYVACRGNLGPVGFDSNGDRTYSCPAF